MKTLFNILCLIPFLLPTLHAAPAAPDQLSSREAPNRVGLALNEWAFSWKGRGQAAYRILVASAATKLAAEAGDVWDSGVRRSERQTNILCRGRALQPGQAVWWKVRVWDEDGKASDWSEPASFKVPTRQVKLGKVARPTAVNGKPRFVPGALARRCTWVAR